ncbi:protein mono-ADP-ribosyltransferase PARP12-like isoform X3 [Polypterus senegalus]|uniref:protein mono-ADP-ribosyltransferase PARP12-like isoform X3 n=1 Tax=Polypterus senegalus TaxID=55291 RepID=UPI001964BE63|nr:protein mono-ADP-ribosyltransferase PARP12-like isoform X3 [Polypterus senegalus]
MANENIISYATRILCSNLGAMDYNNLRKKLRKRFDPSDDDLRYILWNCCRFSIVQRARDCSPGSELSPDSKIIAKTAVRLCKSYPKDDCKACEGLHLCKYFVYGNCRFGKGRKQCRYSHDLSSDHNYNVLKAYHLTELHEDELFLLLLQNDPSLLPEVCVHYNKGTGPYGACTFKASCTKLHICHHFVQGDCIFGSKCKRLHGIDADGRKLLEDRGLSGEIIHDLPLLYTNIYDLKNNSNNRINDRIQQTSTENSSNNEICLHYLRRLCSFQENCIRVHFHLPYKWEVYDGSAWKDLPNMEDIEMAYCNPENNRSDGSPQVDFMNMKCDSCPVRRLSTPSSVTKPPHYILTTEWIWYYKSSKGRWTEYGKTDEKQKVHSLTSKELEEAFLGENMGEIEVSKGHRQYIISFKDMYQRNPKYNTKRKVQRRPRFTSAQDVESRITIKSNSVIHSSTSTIFPDHWDKESLPESGYKLIQLSCTSEEFKRIKDLFTKTMHLETIRGIQRIQNQSLWETFQCKIYCKLSWEIGQTPFRCTGQDLNPSFWICEVAGLYCPFLQWLKDRYKYYKPSNEGKRNRCKKRMEGEILKKSYCFTVLRKLILKQSVIKILTGGSVEHMVLHTGKVVILQVMQFILISSQSKKMEAVPCLLLGYWWVRW